MSDEERTRLLKPTEVSKPAASRSEAPTSDEATRVIGSSARSGNPVSGTDEDPVTRLASSSKPEPRAAQEEHELVAGWLVITSGPGRGNSREIYFGMNSVGRSQNQRIPLDFGDENISREGHAFVVFDDMQQDFYIQHGGKSNLIRLNGKPVLSPMELTHGDMIDIGATRLIFVPLCSDTFSWSTTQAE